jgi:predicted nuclease of predicted toxin-antitoxin system
MFVSYKLVAHLKLLGFETIYVNEILNKSETKDSDICKYSDQNNLVVITKDADFRNSYFIKQTPRKLIKINLGNISNHELITIFSENIHVIQKLDSKPNFLLEVDKDNISVIEIDSNENQRQER